MTLTYPHLAADEQANLAAYLSQLGDKTEGLEDLLHIALGRALAKTTPFVLPQHNDDKVRHIVDWLKGALINDEPWLLLTDAQGRKPKKLWQIGSIDRALTLANKSMAHHANRLRSQFKNDGLENDIQLGKIRIFKQLDGCTLVQLLTGQALQDETAQLGHCIGNGAYDDVLADPNVLLLSLRDRNNKAHVTIEVENGVLTQMKGKKNAPPIEKYMKKLHPFLKTCGWVLGENPSHTGLITQDGVVYEVQNLPPGFIYRSDLALGHAKWLKKLSDNLSVEGKLVLNGCTAFTHLPDNLSVSEHLALQRCTALTHLPDRVHVAGEIDSDEGKFWSWDKYRAAFYHARPHLTPKPTTISHNGPSPL